MKKIVFDFEKRFLWGGRLSYANKCFESMILANAYANLGNFEPKYLS